ncbi:hypothetical protein C4569_02525 [Candidatus Parcubacteria bacterium]|nr:MAG: hypothetical protein C4569_02525 [Candidatus Parcubacteria bacterium]
MLEIILTFILLPVIFFNVHNNFIEPETNKKTEEIFVKGIYLTAYSVSSKAKREEVMRLLEETELNSLIIDIKDYTGKVLYDSEIPLVNELGTEEIVLSDLTELLPELKKNNIYVIARMAVFQDPALASKKSEWALKNRSGGIWRDRKGQAWVDTSNREVWKYNLDIAKEAVKLGFDEINLDYIRFPTDGNLSDIVYPFYDSSLSKNDVMAEFFRYFGGNFFWQPALTSVDLFGLTLISDDGLNIGQRIEDAAPYFDYISPMVYPSHFADGYKGFANPAQYPYEVVYKSLRDGAKKIAGTKAKYRPWLQDFDLGADYDSVKVKDEIRAAYDSESSGWMLWNAKNIYTKEALFRP